MSDKSDKVGLGIRGERGPYPTYTISPICRFVQMASCPLMGGYVRFDPYIGLVTTKVPIAWPIGTAQTGTDRGKSDKGDMSDKSGQRGGYRKIAGAGTRAPLCAESTRISFFPS